MTESTTENSFYGDVPDANHKSPSKQSNLTGPTLMNSGFGASFNASGALQQLSELLSLHAKGGAMNEFKGDYSSRYCFEDLIHYFIKSGTTCIIKFYLELIAVVGSGFIRMLLLMFNQLLLSNKRN